MRSTARRLSSMLLVAVVVATTGCGVSVQTAIQRADHGAYDAVRGFQVAEEAAYHGHAGWPTPAEHQAINAKVSRAYSLIIDVANIGLALQPGQSLDANALAVLGQLEQVVRDILAAVRPEAPAKAMEAAQTLRRESAGLVNRVKGAQH